MILANVRGRLRGADFRLVVLALARGDPAVAARAERRLLAEGPDALLDEPGLLEGLLALRSLVVPSPPLFTSGAVRHRLLAAGVDDRDLADYLAALLLEFGQHNRHARIGGGGGVSDDQTYNYLVDIVSDLSQEPEGAERGFLLQAHLGNYSLWLAGLFPHYNPGRRPRAGGPGLLYYDGLGRQGDDPASRPGLAERVGGGGGVPGSAGG